MAAGCGGKAQAVGTDCRVVFCVSEGVSAELPVGPHVRKRGRCKVTKANTAL